MSQRRIVIIGDGADEIAESIRIATQLGVVQKAPAPVAPPLAPVAPEEPEPPSGRRKSHG